MDQVRNVDIKLHPGNYEWGSDYLDVTSYSVGGDMELELSINKPHEFECVFQNDGLKFTRRSNKYIFKRGRAVTVTIGTTDYKFKITKVKPEAEGEFVYVKMRSLSTILFDEPCQIRVGTVNGVSTVEDTIFQALYDTGLHNFINIKVDSGDDYKYGMSSDKKVLLTESTDIIYMRRTVGEILDEITEKTGCIWFEENDDSSDTDVTIRIKNMDVDYEADSGDFVEFSTYHEITSVNQQVDETTVINKVYFDNLGLYVTEPDSIREYGVTEPKKLSFNRDMDRNKAITYAKKLLSVSKDPAISVDVSISGLWIIDSLNMFLKVTDINRNLHTRLNMNRKLRIQSIKYNFDSVTTEIQAGNIARNIFLEKIEDILKTGSNTQDDETYVICKSGKLQFRLYTDDTYLSDPTSASTSGPSGYKGARANIDPFYDSSEASGVKFYLDDDGLIGGD